MCVIENESQAVVGWAVEWAWLEMIERTIFLSVSIFLGHSLALSDHVCECESVELREMTL